MIKVIKTIPGYNGIPLPAGCPTFLRVLIKILNQYISTPTKFVVDEKVLSIAILNEAMHTFSVMLNYFSKDGNRQPRFATDELKIITGTMKTSNPKRVTKSELSNYFLKHASIAPDQASVAPKGALAKFEPTVLATGCVETPHASIFQAKNSFAFFL